MLTENNRKTELSYACLRRLAVDAGLTCSPLEAYRDGAGANESGVDVRLDIHERLDSQSLLTRFSLDFHLQATSRKLAVVNSKLAFSLEASRYERLRGTTVRVPSFVVLLTLPEEPESWLTVSAAELIANRGARWLCLRGAPETTHAAAIEVRFPVWNALTPAALREIARRVSVGGRFFHEQ
jgi:hypothetical protein